MRIIGVKISIHVTNFTLIVTHVLFAEKSKFYVIIVLYFVVGKRKSRQEGRMGGRITRLLQQSNRDN